MSSRSENDSRTFHYRCDVRVTDRHTITLKYIYNQNLAYLKLILKFRIIPNFDE